MICKNPYVQGLQAFPCGGCMPCRINRKRLWTHRLTLESLCHESCSFATLTYDDVHHPKDGSLQPLQMQLWMKSLREHLRVEYQRYIRFFLVGEYGDISWRPHYHIAFFGFGLEDLPILEKLWDAGFVYLGTLNKDSAAYIAGYVTKKLTKAGDPRLNGRYPEFMRSSKGIGKEYMKYVAQSLNDVSGTTFIQKTGDVPLVLRSGGRSHPLGRFLRKKLREELGFLETGSQGLVYEKEKKLRDLYAHKLSAKEVTSYKEFLIKHNLHRIASLEARFKMFNQGRLL